MGTVYSLKTHEIALFCSRLAKGSMCMDFTAPRGSKTRIHAMCNVRTERKSTVIKDLEVQYIY